MPISTETSLEVTTLPEGGTDGPSADFIQAISRFLDTDPSDLLREMGYYRREDEESTSE